MLVYGGIRRRICVADRLEAIRKDSVALAGMPDGIARHAALAALFIDAGELTCGIADAEFEVHGSDRPTPAQHAAMSLQMGLAGALRASWNGRMRKAEPCVRHELAALSAVSLPASVSAKPAEGFAFYALYPEAFAAAADRSALPSSTQVIGIRSIGTPLSAMVASALGTAAPLSVRPIGPPFDRELSVSPGFRRRLGAHEGPFAVVDEGPGLSGSSFGAVADLLESEGIDRRRIAFFPSHPGPPGPQAAARRRLRWLKAARHVAAFEDLILARLRAWAEELTGPGATGLEDISGGGWRRYRTGDRPPVNAQQERRKYLLRSGGSTWLLKFAGLGREGERKTAMARALHDAGFSPAVLGWRHGFLVEEWLTDARPLNESNRPRDIGSQIGRYLGFRAASFPAEEGSGSSATELWEMARVNIGKALGAHEARYMDRWSAADLSALQKAIRPVAVDGRLHPWEWLVDGNGRLIKCDAIDHHCAHDLIGCQDIAWDVVGAEVELAIGDEQRQVLRSVLGRAVDDAVLAFYRPCYLAFQLGSYVMAEAAAAPGEQALLSQQAGRYRRMLVRLLLPAAPGVSA
jgi:hypothetical protein